MIISAKFSGLKYLLHLENLGETLRELGIQQIYL